MFPHVIIFSKDRPLQLRATVESLLFATGIPADEVHILTPSTEVYREYAPSLFSKLCVFHEEEQQDFAVSLARLLWSLDPKRPVLLEVDDSVWINYCNLQAAVRYLHTMPEANKVCGFSLRLGDNVGGCPEHVGAVQTAPLLRQWVWTNAIGHWGYPFSVGTAIYPWQMLRDVTDFAPQLRLPNDLEDAGWKYLRSNASRYPYMLAFAGPARAVAQDINRVQSCYPNPVSGGQEHKAANLLRKDVRIFWEKMWQKQYPDCFARGRDWELAKDE